MAWKHSSIDRAQYSLPIRRAPFILRKAAREGVVIFDLSIKGNRAFFYVDRGAEAAIENVFLRENVDWKKEKDRSAKRFFALVKARPFLLIFSLISVFLIVFSQLFVCRTEIRGNLNVNTSVIESVLRENKIRGLTFKRAIDLSELRRSVAAVEGIAFASITIRGNKLRVEVKEELPDAYSEEMIFDPVQSRMNAVVTKIVTESGTPRVSVGDKVEAGRVLIDPVYSFTEGEAPAPARGEVYGVTTYVKQTILPQISVQSERTGKRFAVRISSVFGKRSQMVSSPFPSYDLSERVVFSLFGGKVEVREITFYERRDVSVYHDFDREIPLLIEKQKRELLSYVPFYASSPFGITVEQKKIDNTMYIVLYYSVEQRIDSLFSPE